MGRDGRPDLEELGWKCLLLIETLMALSQGVAERIHRSETVRGEETERKPSRGWGECTGSQVDVEAELGRMRRRLDMLEQRYRDGGAAVSDVAAPGADRGSGRRERRGSSSAGGPAPARLDRASSRRRALQAALQLRREGKPVTLASVARAGGLKYSQVVYAFGRRGDLLREVEEAERAGG